MPVSVYLLLAVIALLLAVRAACGGSLKPALVAT
jgi:hypothetical protein